MRKVKNRQMALGEVDLKNIEIDVQSRDDIPRILLGLQHIYCNSQLRTDVFKILEEIVPVNKHGNHSNSKVGRPGMDQWEILVLGMLRLCLNTDYDRVVELANNHRVLRQVLSCDSVFYKSKTYKYTTVRDNIRLLTPDHLDRINQLIVRAGHELLGQDPEQKISGRCDSFVLTTDVSFPTDIKLLFIVTRKIIMLCSALYDEQGIGDWRQSAYNIRRLKQQYRIIQKTRHSNSKKEEVKAKKEKEIAQNVTQYLSMGQAYLERAKATLKEYESCTDTSSVNIELLRTYMIDMDVFMDQIDRRILKGEDIPHNEKIFSIFQRHTEWISKGKAGTPVELGVRVCIVEDRSQFILHHQVMEKTTDDKIAVSIMKETQERFANLSVVSMDKGFHSKENQIDLKKLLDQVILPKKGKQSKADRVHETDPEFVRLRLDRSAVESAINSLQVHGLNICRDHGIEGLKRYAAMAVLAHNIHRIGAIIRQKAIKKERALKRRLKKVA